MSKRRSTKKALLLSLLSLLLCSSMFVGTTYAWFTDSVTSMNNVIKSGDLSVGLEYSLDGETWAPVSEDVSIFGEEDLWEPGDTIIAAFRVKNTGTLDLEYALSTGVYLEREGVNVLGETFKFSDYLEIYASPVMEDNEEAAETIKQVFATEDQKEVFREASSEESGSEEGFVMLQSAFNTDLAQCDLLASEKSHVMLVGITLPLGVGNKANYKIGTEAPYVRFGISLYATQAQSEEDSFCADYDANAKFEIAPTAKVSILNLDAPVPATAGMGGAVIDGGLALDAAFLFETTETDVEAQKSDFRYWHADFVVTSDQPVAEDSIALAGYYKAYCEDYNNGNWVALINQDMPVEKGEEIRLLSLMLNGGSMSYQELCQWVPEFRCGLKDRDGSNAGATITVELRLYEVSENTASVEAETGRYVTVGTYAHTF